MKLLRSPVGLFRLVPMCVCVLLASSMGLSAQPLKRQLPQPDPRAAVSAPKVEAPKEITEMITIPGPLRSFRRMAGLSQFATAAEIMPLLAHQVVVDGYQQNTPTEYLLLLQRYLVQAKQLQALAGPTHTIRVEKCEDTPALFLILGYQLRHGCTADIVLEAVNTDRAFLTVDSGFPLNDLEEALQKGVPFVYEYAPSSVPIMFHESDWIKLSSLQRQHFSSTLDALLGDTSIARLYSALGKTDIETRNYLQRSLGLPALLTVAPVLNFYGSRFSVRSGHVLVPGGINAESAWKSLVGVSPASPAAFAVRLFSKDDGWQAAYFDFLSRIDATQQHHLLSNGRLERNYTAFRTADLKNGAAHGVYPHGSNLLVLYTRLQWEPNGDPHIPGGLEVWKELLSQSPYDKVLRKWVGRGHGLDQPDQLLEVMSALSRSEEDKSLFNLYLSLSELDRRRTAQRPLAPSTVKFLAAAYSKFDDWYPVFSEFPDLNDEAITRFIKVAEAVEQTKNMTLRANALGAFQANVGLWQILARQQQIPAAAMTESWLAMIQPFEKITTSLQLFDSARSSLGVILRAATPKPNDVSGDIIELLAGPPQESPDGVRVHTEVAGRMHAVLEDQRLVSLPTLFALSDGLAKMEQTGEKGSDELIALAGELREFELPRPIFTRGEKIAYAPGVYTSRHAELQIQTDLAKVIKGPSTRAQLEAARGQLAPFLRDTLVGLNYAFYEPPGAQILHINPLFVRAHDFLSISVIGSAGIWQKPELIGAGISAGGGAYLMGSLVALPYSLATAEGDFLVPRNVQALMWVELVPNLIQEAVVPRWWDVSPNELHAVSLYQRSGEEILRSAVDNATARERVMAILADRLDPKRLEEMRRNLAARAEADTLLQCITPSESLYLTKEYRRMYPDEATSAGSASQELAALAARSPKDADIERISCDFGVSHPTLAQTNSRELLNLQPFPLSGGMTSRLFGESLESSNLYWARLADELGYSPVMLNRLVPELTRHMVDEIFATNIEDWPALQRAMRSTGDDFRSNRIPPLHRSDSAAAGQQTGKSTDREGSR